MEKVAPVMITRTRRLLLFLLSALVAFTASYSAARALGRKRDVRAKLGSHVDKVLKIVKATSAQRAQVNAALAEVMRTADAAFTGTRGGVAPDVEEAIGLFASDHVDQAALDALKARREARHAKLADALVQAFSDVHAALTAEQRQKLTDYEHGQIHGAQMRAFKETLIAGFVNAQVDDILDQIGASEAERRAAHEARDRILDALKIAHADRGDAIEQLAAMFRSDVVDKQTLVSFRAAQEDKLRALVDVIEKNLVTLHDTLTPEHRSRIIVMVRDLRGHPRRGASTGTGGELQ